jgi:predicted dehydrogenase
MKTCCDKNKQVLEKVKSQYAGNINITDDFDGLIKDPQIDAVVIATLPVTHAHFALKALSAGKHVFVEKPLALDLDDGKEMIKAAKRNKKILMVGHLLLYHPAVKRLKDYIEDGSLGKVHYLYSSRVNLGQVREEENALWSLTAHDISVAIYLLKEQPFEVSVTGKSYLRKEIQDVVFVTLNFKNKVMAHIHASWLDPHKVRKFTVVGSNKMAVFDDMESAEKLKIYDKGFDWQKKNNYGTYETFLTIREGDIYMPKINMVEPLKLECRHFIESIKNNTQPLSDGENGLEVLKVLTAAQKSLEENGKPFKIG